MPGLPRRVAPPCAGGRPATLACFRGRIEGTEPPVGVPSVPGAPLRGLRLVASEVLGSRTLPCETLSYLLPCAMRVAHPPLRAVLDTNILRAGIRNRRRPEHHCLLAVAAGAVTPLATPGMFLEYEEVLTRAMTLEATGLSAEDIHQFLTGLAAVIEPVGIHFDWRPLLPDPDDDMVANCAVNGFADCVVTNNLRHLRMLEERFGIPVLRPEEFLLRLEARRDPSQADSETP